MGPSRHQDHGAAGVALGAAELPKSRQAPLPTAGVMGAPAKTGSVEAQLTEVYGLVDELNALTDRIRSKVETVLDTLSEENTRDPQ